MRSGPPNPLENADIFSLDEVQVTLAPVGCRNPYVRYAARQPYVIQANAADGNNPPFVQIVRFPTLGYTRMDAQFWAQLPVGQIPLLAQVQYYLAAYKDLSPPKPFGGGVLSLPYDQSDEETVIAAKSIGLFCRVLALGLTCQIAFSFSVLLEPS